MNAENDAPLEPAFDRIGGSECPVCLGLGFRCHPDGGLVACVEVCDRCEAAVERRATDLLPRVLPPDAWPDSPPSVGSDDESIRERWGSPIPPAKQHPREDRR